MSSTVQIPHVLRRLETLQPGQPRITWYDHQGRIELSGKVLSQWVAKTANFLAEQGLEGAELVLCTDLPCHWRRSVLALSAWVLGGSFQQVPQGAAVPVETTVWATSDAVSLAPGAPFPHAAQRLAVPLAALAQNFGSELEVDVLDYALEVPSAADNLQQWAPTADDQSVALGTHLAALEPHVGERVVLDASQLWSEFVLAAVIAGQGSWVGVGVNAGTLASVATHERATPLAWVPAFAP